MAPRGRPPKPVEQLKRTGTYRKDRHQQRTTTMTVGSPDLSVIEGLDALAIFHTTLSAGWPWFVDTDSAAVVMLREALEERAEIRAMYPAGSKERRGIDEQIGRQLSALGFDPASRARLGLAEVKAASKLDEIRQRRAAAGLATPVPIPGYTD